MDSLAKSVASGVLELVRQQVRPRNDASGGSSTSASAPGSSSAIAQEAQSILALGHSGQPAFPRFNDLTFERKSNKEQFKTNEGIEDVLIQASAAIDLRQPGDAKAAIDKAHEALRERQRHILIAERFKSWEVVDYFRSSAQQSALVNSPEEWKELQKAAKRLQKEKDEARDKKQKQRKHFGTPSGYSRFRSQTAAPNLPPPPMATQPFLWQPPGFPYGYFSNARQGGRGGKSSTRADQCRNCFQSGHWAAQCPSLKQ